MRNNDIILGFDDEKDEHLSIQLERISELPKCILINLKGHADRDNYDFFREQLIKVIRSGFKWLIIGCADFEIHNDIVTFDVILQPVMQNKGGVVLIGIQQSLNWYLEHSFGGMFLGRKNDKNEALEFLRRKSENPVHFPMDFDCPRCGRRTKAKTVGAHLCYGCKTILLIDGWGDVSITQSKNEGLLGELPLAEDDASTES